MLRTALKPGRQTPIRTVPASIPRPEYVGRDRPAPSTDPSVASDYREIARTAGAVRAQLYLIQPHNFAIDARSRFETFNCFPRCSPVRDSTRVQA